MLKGTTQYVSKKGVTHVEDAEKEDEEGGAPSSLESDSDHDTSSKPKDGNDDSEYAPLPLDDEPNKEEDQQNPPSKLEVNLAIRL